MQDDGFVDTLLGSIKNQVTMGDLFASAYHDDPSLDTDPIAVIPKDTKIADISTAIKNAIDTETVARLKQLGMLPIDASAEARLDSIFGAIVLDEIDGSHDLEHIYDTSTPKGQEAQDAINAIVGVAKGKVSDVTDTDQLIAAGNYLWMNMTAKQLIDVLIFELGVKIGV